MPITLESFRRLYVLAHINFKKRAKRRFLQKAKLIHGNNYNYDLVESHHINNNKSREQLNCSASYIPLICNQCDWLALAMEHPNI